MEAAVGLEKDVLVIQVVAHFADALAEISEYALSVIRAAARLLIIGSIAVFGPRRLPRNGALFSCISKIQGAGKMG